MGVEGAAHGHVEDLNPPADGQEGHAPVHRQANQVQLHGIPLGQDASQGASSVAGEIGRDVAPTGEDQTMDQRQELAPGGLLDGEREEQGNASRCFHGAKVTLRRTHDRGFGLSGVSTGGNADNRSRGHRASF